MKNIKLFTARQFRIMIAFLALATLYVSCKGNYHGRNASTRTVFKEKHK